MRRGRDGWSWNLDETYVRVSGRWCDLCRSIDRHVALRDSMLSEHRDRAAARWFLRGRLDVSERRPLRVTTDTTVRIRRRSAVSAAGRRSIGAIAT